MAAVVTLVVMAAIVTLTAVFTYHHRSPRALAPVLNLDPMGCPLDPGRTDVRHLCPTCDSSHQRMGVGFCPPNATIAVTPRYGHGCRRRAHWYTPNFL